LATRVFQQGIRLRSAIPWAFSILLCTTANSWAQTNVTTQHNDIARTGQNANETILTPANVNTNSFGKLFYYVVDGYVYAQPLYMSNVTMGAGTPQAGTKHNVIFIATEHDSVYAFDADSNLGANGKPLWRVTLLDSEHGAAAGATTVPTSDIGSQDVVPEYGITSTPVIDPPTNTIYVVGLSKENGSELYRLHALDITTGGEKFGGPVLLSGSVAGNGQGSSSGTLQFNARYEMQRPGLLLLNGIVYIGFGSHGDSGPWHGWILGYKAATLKETGAWCSTSNGFGAGIWDSGTGLTANVPDPVNHPYGYLYSATGTGTVDPTAPYTDAMGYSVSVFKLDLNNGVPTILDEFSPFDASALTTSNRDQGSGGPIVLPDSVGGGKHLFMQVGKTGRVYIFDQYNLGGYHPSNTSDPQAKAAVNGEVYGGPAYWNGNIYIWARNDRLKAFSIANGVLSGTPTSTAAEVSGFPGPASAVSANGTSNAIVWSVQTDGYTSQSPEILYAHEATNVANLLYSSNENVTRDNPGAAVKFVSPTIVNGKVYLGAEGQVAIYGLLNGATQAARPVISPVGQLFHPSIQVTITDSSPNAQIFYTTDGSLPSTASSLYTGPITITSTTKLQAVAVGTGYVASTVASESYTLVNQVPTATFSPAGGDYTSAQQVTIATTWPGSTIYYTTNGSTPTTASTQYTGPVAVSTSTTLKAIATAPNLTNSAVATALYTIVSNAASSVDFRNGFSSGSMHFVGKAGLSGTRLRLTDGGTTEASAAWYPSQLNVQAFSTDFTFQQAPGTSPPADGITFAIQGVGTSAIGLSGGGLGYGAQSTTGTQGIPKSVALKFDLFNNGQGNNCTGVYTNGAAPLTCAVKLGGGISLPSGDIFAVHLSYDGTTLALTITDTANSSDTFTTSWPINIPGTVGGNTAYVGFTGGTGHYTLVQDILSWTYVSTASVSGTTATPVITPATGAYSSAQTVTISDSTSGSTIYYTLDGSQPTTSSTKYTGSFTVSTTSTVKAIAGAANFAQSATATSVITIGQSMTATPTITPATGTYPSAQTVTISDSTSGATIYYTLDGSQPTTSSTKYTGSFTVSTTTTVKATASAPNFAQSATATSVITIQSSGGGTAINFGSGFTAANLQFNGRTKLNGTHLELTDGGQSEASSAWFTAPVNVQSFTTDFTFQLTNPNADGMTFTIQNTGLTALGGPGGGLGYGSSVCGSTTGITASVAIKFDLFQNCQEGNNSTGLYVNGASPTVPSTTFGGGINLHSGDPFAVHITYNGTILTMTITDTVNTSETFSASWNINIPGTVGSGTAFVGFTAGTGGQTATQQILTWTYGP
jgi:Legume lectin domain/Chitobiase/beta-hexosaminidase C-terminal domain